MLIPLLLLNGCYAGLAMTSLHKSCCKSLAEGAEKGFTHILKKNRLAKKPMPFFGGVLLFLGNSEKTPKKQQKSAHTHLWRKKNISAQKRSYKPNHSTSV